MSKFVKFPNDEQEFENMVEFEGEDVMSVLEKIGDILVKRTDCIKKYEKEGNALETEIKEISDPLNAEFAKLATDMKKKLEAAVKPMNEKAKEMDERFQEELKAYNKELDKLIAQAKSEDSDE